MNDTHLLLLVPILFLGGVFYAVARGGLGIIMILFLNTVFPIHVSIALSGILAIGIQIAKASHFRSAIRWDIVWWYALPGVPAAYLAGTLLFAIPSRAIELAIGTFCAWTALREIFPGLLDKSLRLRPKRATLVIGGTLNGLVAGLIGNGNMLRAPLLLAFGLRKEIFIGTSGLIALILNMGRTVAYAKQIPWEPDMVTLIVTMIPVMYGSVIIGKKLLHYVSERMFEVLQAGIMATGAIRFLFFPS